MRGDENKQPEIFSYTSVEVRIPNYKEISFNNI